MKKVEMTYHKVDEGNYFITENDFFRPENFQHIASYAYHDSEL